MLRFILFGLCLLVAPPAFSDALAKDNNVSGQWRAVKDTDLRIMPGSILDFSDLFGGDAKPEISPIGVNNQGQLALKEGTGPRIRFLCATLLFGGPHGPLPDHKTADVLADQLRMHGYNLVRFHFIDAALMEGREKDFDYNPEALDRFYYLLSALKRQGIYWMMDAATNWGGAYAPGSPGSERNLRLDFHIYNTAQEHWKKMVTTILGRKNPYTKIAPLEDPTLVVLTLVNESGLEYLTREGYQADLLEPFRQWLLNKYETVAGIKEAWGDASINTLEQVMLPEKKESSPRQTDLLRFFADLETHTLQWASNFLRKQGYGGQITNYNNGRSVYSRAVGQHLSLVTQHGYYDHPSDFIKPGSQQQGGSSIADNVPYVRDFASSRYGGQPFIVDEYDHPFWNPWRREAGLVVPAYAAFQDWDGIAHFANPIILSYGKSTAKRHTAIHPFGIGMDPVARAGDTLAALLFRRADVRPAQSNVLITLNSPAVFNERQGRWRPMPDDLSTLALVKGLGLSWNDATDVAEHLNWKADLILPLQHAPTGKLNKAVNKLADKFGKDSNTTWAEHVATLKASHNLPTENRTNPTKNTYQSDTGQILLEADKRRMTVITPNTEAAVFDSGLPLMLSRLTIESADAPALVAVSSIDGHPLPDSARMLIILATDALNSGMRFSADRTTLQDLGGLPVLIRTAAVTISLKHRFSNNLRLYSTTLNGKRMDTIPVEKITDGIRFTLDTSALSHGPTTYFELVEEQESQ